MPDARSFRPERMADAVDRAFEAAICPDLWPSVFQDIAEAAGGVGVIALHGDMSDRDAYLCSPGLVEALAHYCEERWFERNPRIAEAVSRREFNRLTTDATLVGSTQEFEPAWHHDFLRRFDLGWFAGTFLYADARSKLLISIERSHRVDPFQSAEIEVLDRAMARLRNAVALVPALDRSAALALATGFEHVGCAAIVLDREGRIVLMNESASKGCGGALRVRDGRLCLSTGRANDRLQMYIANLLRSRASRDHAPPEPLVFTELDGTIALLRGAPLARGADDLFRSASVVITLTFSNDQAQNDERLIQRLFAMTAAEARIASQVASGLEPKAISEMCGTTVHTVRSQLRSVFAKTDTKRQVELALLINKLRCGARL